MTKCLAPLPFVVLVAAMVGCSQPDPGRMRVLGTVDQDLAFTTAKDVMSQYFEIQSADPDTRTIKCQPKNVQEYKERLLGGSPTRQIAKLEILNSEGQTVARVSVAIQQQGSASYRSMKVTEEPYSSVPTQTPAEVEGATTVEQNETWKTINYSYQTERKILDDLFRRLHPEFKE